MRIRTMAAQLIAAARTSWGIPAYVAPLNLEESGEGEEKDAHPTTLAEIADTIDSGGNLVLFGEGGIGKTTLLVELSTTLLDGGVRRIPLYVDAAMWAESNANVFDYISATAPAQRAKVTSSELTRLAAAGHLALLVNGWNEIPGNKKLLCRDQLNQLATVADALSVVIVSRTASDTARLPEAKRLEVRGLTWQGQSDIIKDSLGADAASALLDVLVKDTRLRHAARVPLILRGLIAQAQIGLAASSSVYDLLAAAVQSFEGDDQRHLVLAEAPLQDFQSHFLEELACEFTARSTTTLSREGALTAITAAGTALEKRGIVSRAPDSSAVLNTLCSHHLLHTVGHVVRFAHQRFQEYYAAARLLKACASSEELPRLLNRAANQPAWEDSLMLVAGKLKGADVNASARARLVNAAASVDLVR